MKKILLALTLLPAVIFAQFGPFEEDGVFFEAGMNFTSYNYSDDKGASNNNIKPGTGVFIRAGLGSIGYKSGFNYGISLNQFNATGGNGFDLYDWKVTHLGGFGQWNRFLNKSQTLGFNVALEISSMISGRQVLGEKSYRLSEYDEFKGIWFDPRVGINYRAISNESIFIEVGYFSQLGYNLTGGSSESLSFFTHQLGIKLNIQ